MLRERRGRLRELQDASDEVTLVPLSGIQMLDFGFAIDAVEMRPHRFVERVVSAPGEPLERALIPLTGDPDRDAPVEAAHRDDDDEYSIRPAAALDPFLGHWVPVPVLRLRGERGPGGQEMFDPGPSTWARMRIVALDAPDPATGHSHRVQIALDTALMEALPGRPYLAPEPADSEKSREFRLVADAAGMDWFLRRPEPAPDGTMVDLQLWVSDWLRDLFLAHKRAERPGRPVTEDSLPHLFEHWARYLTLLDLIDRAVRPPKIRLANTMPGRDAVVPVEVDLVLDVGNSRTCGILIERFPGAGGVDLTRSFPLEIRDLSAPEFTCTGLFESRVEFCDLRLGDDRHAGRSGRRNAFLWPGFVRVGPEAMRKIAGDEGTETTSGLSSPKRYLWDTEPRPLDWRFHDHADPGTLPKGVRAAMRHLNEAGDVIDQVAHEEARRLRQRGRTATAPAIRPRFSRSALYGFLIAEIIAHALVQVNDPASRARRAQSDLPRRLTRIILTLPTATSAQEQAILRSRAEGALRLVWAMQGIDDGASVISARPELIVDWDEASCTQLVWLYSELTQKFDGRIDTFLDLKGQPRIRPGATRPDRSLRLACIDIGGGTTDLMITTVWAEANRMLHPHQTFREGFRVAGDDLAERVIAAVVLPRLQASIEAAGGRHAGDKIREVFGGDIGGQDQQKVQKRRQFGLRVLSPLAVAILERCETAGEYESFEVTAAEVLGLDPEGAGQGSGGLPADLAAFVQDMAAGLGATDWRLADLTIPATREDIDAIARETFQQVLGNMAEVIHHLGCDVLLLTGRPSRLPAVRSILQELMPVPPGRLIPMHRYRAGRWYPFRDPVTQRIGDPKSTVAVGAMLIALAESQIANLRVPSAAFRMRSTARYIGEMDTSGQITADRVLFSDVDLDAKGAGQTATVAMFAPVLIGARQLPLDRWTTTPLYRLDYANDAARRRPAPIRLTLERADAPDDDPEAPTAEDVLRREALREAFRVTDPVEDGAGDGMKPGDVVLRLQTLGFVDDYWIDTGVFRI